MGSHAIAWLTDQYRYVLGRMRAHQFRQANPSLGDSIGRDRGAHRRNRCQCIKAERLEGRVLLAATLPNPTVTGTAGNDVISVTRDAAQFQVRVGSTVIGSWNASQVNSLTVDGLAGDDLIVLSDDVGTAPLPEGGLVLLGGAGADILAGPGGATTWAVNGTGAGTVGGARFGAFENLRGAAGNNDSFVFDAAGSVTGIVDGGAGGFDVIELRSGRFRNVVFTTLGPTSGTISRDGDVINYTDFEPIVDATGGAKTFNATASKDEILLDYRSGDEAVDGIFVSSDTGEDVILTNEMETTGLTINTAGGDDDVRLSGIVALTGFNLRVDTGTGDDRIRLDDGIVDDNRNVTLIGGDGFDELEYVPIDDFGDVTVTDNALRVTNPTNTVALSGIERALIETIQNQINVDGFTGQVVHVTNAPRWGTLGPRPYSTVLDGATAPWDPAAGAINAIAVDPNDRFTTYLGTVNGGIWRNTGSKEVFFDVDQSSLTADDMVTLNAFSDFLENFQRVTVEIAGHTDSGGDDATNLTLSQARAQSVRDYLVNVRRVDPARLRVVAYGEDRPVAENIGGRQARNRRVELLVENWQPLTDGFPSLSISSIAVSPLSSKVLYAGIGRTSSFRAGGEQSGLLVSTDGGDNWRVLAADTLRSLTVSQVVPTMLRTRTGAQEVYVSTYDVDRDANGVLDDLGGLFHLEVSPDGRLSGGRKISGVGGFERGLPAGHYTDLVVDPGIPGNPQRPMRLYAANPAFGVYQLTDGDDFMWHAVNTGFTMGRDSDGNGADDLLQRSSRIEFALHPRTGAIYAAVLGPVDGTGLFNITGQRVGLIGLYKSEDFAGTWAAMPLPRTTDNGTTYGLHAGRNGDIHFSIAVDPTDEDIVYLGGDRQGATTNNSAGLTSFAGRLFVFDDLNQTWVQIVGNNANGTAPHADSRGMVFTSDYTLMEIDDGGLYRLQNPAGDVDQGTRRWTSANRNLVISEVLRLAFDTVNEDLLVGTQDNGSAMQGADSDRIDNDLDGQTDEVDESGLWTGTRGDGNSQAVIPVDTNGDSAPDRVLRYSLHNTFNDLQVREFTSAGVLIDADGFPRNTFHSVGLRTGPGAGPRSALNAQDAALTFDLIPMVVNANDPTRMLIGYYGIYESINTNINPGAGQARVLPLDQVRQVHPASGAQVPAGSQVTALVYGGTSGGVKNNDLIIASRGNKVLIRRAVGQAFSERAITGAGTIRDLKADPKNWKTLYAIDSTDVYRIDDVTDLTKNWVKITANLKAVGQYDLRALEFIDDYREAESRSLLVGGAGGVSRLFNPAAAPAREQWVRVGRGLPNAPVFDILWVDDPNAPPETRNVLSGSDSLFAATLGRGAWYLADILGVGGRSLLQVYGATTADQFKLIRDPANPLMVNLFDLSRSDTDPVFRPIRGSTFDRIEVYTRGGDDALTLDHSHGAVQVPQGIRYDGGEAGSNSLVLKGEAYGARQSGTDADGKRFELVLDLKDRRQYVRLENVAVVKDAGMPRVIDNGVVTIEGAMESLVEALTFRDELSSNLPVFGSSVGRALNGLEVTEPPPVSTPGAGAPPLAAEVVEASSEAVNLLRRFIEVGKGAFAIDRISEFTTLAQLQAAFKGLDESGAGVVSITGDLTNGFEIGLAGIKKRLSGRADLGIKTSDGKVDVSGLVDVSADVTLNLVFGVDETHGFYIRSNPGADVVVDGIRVTGTDAVIANGRFGFLGVDMTRAVVAMDPAVRLEISVQETGGDGFIQLPELLADPARYVDVTLVSAPGNGVNDVTLTGTFSTSAIIPGTPVNIPLFDANVELRWADLANPANVTLNAPAGSTGAKVLEFLSVTGPQVIDQLKALRGHLDALAKGPMHIDLSVVQDVIDDLVRVIDLVDREIVNPLQGGANVGAAVSTIQEFVATLAGELDIPVDSLAYDVATGDLTYHVTLSEKLLSASTPAGLHFELPAGLSLDTSADATADGNFDLDFVFGINVRNIAAGGAILDNVFLNNASMGANVAVAVADLDVAARVGFLEVSTSGGTVDATAAVSLALKDPNSPTNRRLTMRALGSAITARPLDLLVGRAPTLTGSADIELRNITVDGLPGVSPAPGAFVRLGIVDLRAPTNVTTEVVGFDDLLDFNNIGPADVLAALTALCDYLASLKGSSFMSTKVPFTSKTLGDVVDFEKAIADGLLGPLTDPQGRPVAKTAQALADKLSEILGLPAGTINASFDAATKVLTYRVVLSKALAPVQAPIQVSGNLGDVAVLSANTTLSLAGNAALDFVFGADFSRRNVTITATADAPANGRITADAQFRLKVGTNDPVTVTVRAADTATNASIDDLVADLNAALTAAALNGSMVAGRNGNRLTLSTRPGVTRPRITLNATAGNPAITQLRFADGAAAADDVASRFFVSNASVSGNVTAAANNIRLGARLGFIDIGVDNGSADLNAAVSLRLQPPGGPAGAKVTIPQLAGAIVSNPGAVVASPVVTGTARMDLPVVVEGGVLGTIVGTPQLAVRWSDITAPATLLATFNADGLRLLDFKSLTFADVLNALKGVATYFAQLKTFSFLNQKLPLLNKSVTDLVDFATDFADKVAAFEQDPAGSLQALRLKLAAALGLPTNGVLLGIEGKVLKIGFDLSKSVNLSRAVDLDLAALVDELPASHPARTFLQGITTLLDVNGSANLALDADAQVRLNLGLDFTNPGSPRPFVYNTTGVTLGAKASGTNLNFTTALGPLGVFIKNGSAIIDEDGNASTPGDKTVFTVGLKGDPAGRTYLSDLGTDDVNVGLAGQARATLPLYFPTQSNSIGNLSLAITNLSDIPGTITLDAPNLSAQAGALDLINNLGLVIDGLDVLLAGIQSGLNRSVFSHKLPLIGDSFSRAGQFIEDFRGRVISELHAALDGAGDKAVGLVQDGIFNALGPAGLRLLQDVNNDAAVNRDDVPAAFRDADGNGVVDQVQFDLRLHRDLSLVNTPIDFDAGLPGLGLDIDGTVQARLSFDYALSFGVSSDPGIGFYVDTGRANELAVTVQAAIPGLRARGRLGPLTLDATDSGFFPSNLSANFTIDLLDPPRPNAPPPDNRLTYNEVTSGLDVSKAVTARLAADAEVNLGLVLGFGNSASFPSFASDFELKWHFDPADGMEGDVPTVAFKNVRMDLGSFIGSFVGPVLGKVRDIAAPLQPFVDFISKPIPVLSDVMRQPTTVLDLANSPFAAAAFGASAPADARFITALAGIVRLVGGVPTVPSNTFVPLGAFDLAGVDVREVADLSQAAPRVTDLRNPEAAIQQTAARDFFNETKNVGGSGSGLRFPILSSPPDAFKLIMGQDVDLVTYDMAPLALGFKYGHSFGPFPLGPLPVAVTVKLGAAFQAFANLSFGFDTKGIRDAVATGNPADVFGGFYLRHQQGVPELGISGTITAAGEAGVIVADFGLEGAVKASLSAGLRDVDKDGKVYLDEFVNNLDHGLLCTFDVTGKVTAALNAYVTVGVWPVEDTTRWEIAERTLVDWQLSHEDCYSTRLEPNDLSEFAADIGVGPGIHLENLALASPTDQDWYKFTVLRPVDSINVQALFKNAAGNIDMDVVAADGRLLGRSASNKDRELVTLQDVQPGTYYVHVYGHLPETQPNNYRLFVDPGPNSRTRVFYVGNATAANQYYTLGKGDDANDGTNHTRPKATLASLLAAHDLGPDDIVLFDTGSYAGAATVLAEDGGALYAGSPETSTLIGPGTRIVVNDSDGNFFYGLTFGGTGGVGIDLQGDGANDAKDNLVLNSTFRVTGGTGINVGSNGTNVIRNNRFVGSATGVSLHARATATVEGNEISGAATGIYVESAGATIVGNDIHHNGAGVAVNGRGVFGAASVAAANDVHHNTTGVNVFSTASGAVVRFNLVRDNDTGVKTAGINTSVFGNEISGNVTGLTGTGPLGPDDWAYPNDVHHNRTGVLALASTDTVTVTTVVRFNRVHANETGIRLNNGAVAHNNLVYRNTARGILLAGAAGARVVHNTVYEPVADGVHVASGSSNTRLRNNIVWTQAGYGLRVDLDSQAGFDSDYNNLFTSGSGRIGWWQKDFTDLYGWMVEVNSDNHSIGYTPLDPTLDDPKFLNAARDDFRIADFVSTGIDSGDPASPFDLEPAPRGVRVDLGAYGNTPLAARAPDSYIRLDSPNFYDDWEADQGHTIRWHSHGVTGNVTIELYRADGTRVAAIGTAPFAQGSFQWRPADSGVAGDSSRRYRVRVSAGGTVGQSREGFSIPSPGGAFYLNDSSTAGDAYTSARGNLRNTGKTPADPKTVLVGVLRDYDLGPGDTVHADTGHYLHVRDAVLSGNVAINDDEGITITGPTDPTSVAAFDRGGAPGGLPLSLNDGDSITLSHLTLTGGQTGLWVRNASVRFTGTYLTLSGNALDGIRLEPDAVESTLHHLVAMNNGRDGISVAVPMVALTDSVAHHNGAAGFRLRDVGAMRMQRNESYANGVGIDLYNSTNLAPTQIGSTDLAAALGNRVFDNRSDGIAVIGPAVIAGNTVYGHTSANQAGVVASYGAQVLSNVIFGNVDGIQLGWNPGTVGNNRVYDNRRHGISANQSGAAITGNVLYGNAVGLFASSSNFVFTNNLVYGNREHGVSIALAGVGTQLRNNTVYQSAGDAVRVLNSTNPVALRNNILWAGSGYALYFTKDSQTGVSSDYNLFYTTGGGRVGYWQDGVRATFAAWRNASFLDAHSLFGDPLFVNAAAGDFHEQSTAGSFHGGSLAPVLSFANGLPAFPAGAFTPDAANSPAIDRGRPSDPFALEPAPNGAFVNLGAYGNTPQASRSLAPYVTVTNPDGGEILPANQTFTIEWRADSYTGTVDLELLRAGSPAVVLLIADDAPNSGSFAWRVPPTLAAADDYVVRVTLNQASPLADSSNAPFSVVPPIRAYYVNDGTFTDGDWTAAPGDDANDGLSPATPKASIRALLEAYQLGPGDVIKVDAGRYPLTANVIVTAADAGVKLEGYHDDAFPGRVALLDRGSDLVGSYAIELRGAPGTIIDHLHVTRSNAGIYVAPNLASHDLTISNNTVFGNYQHGVFVGAGNDRASVLNNTLFGFPGGASADNQVVGVQVDSAGGTVSGNTAYDGQNIGIYASGPAVNVTGNTAFRNAVGIQADAPQNTAPIAVSGNATFNNHSNGILAAFNAVVSGNTVYGNGGAGIRVIAEAVRVEGNAVFGNLDGISTSSGTPVVHGNRVYNNSRFGLHSQSSSATFSGNVVYSNAIGVWAGGYAGLLTNNLIYANRQHGIHLLSGGSGIRVLNNTVYQTAGDALTVDTPTSVTVRNNILWTEIGYVLRVTPTSQPTFSSDYNTLRATGAGQAAFWNNVAQPTLAAYQNASAQDLHSISDDPQFRNPAGGDGVLGYSGTAAGAAQVLDDSAATFSGTWQTGSGRGYGGGYRSVAAAATPAGATWTFTGLAQGGTYHLATTWPAVVGGGSVEVSVSNGTRLVAARAYNQSTLPNDFTDAGVPWEAIAAVTVTGTTLTVTLSRTAGSPALVDAVRLVRLTGDGGVDDDFHVRPTSPAVDRGHPLSHAYAEPQPSGGRVNQGYDGNTPEAQTSPAQLVQVLSPNGGEKFNAGEAVNISWRSSGLTASRPVLLIDAGGGGVDNWLGDQFGTAFQRPAFPDVVDLSGVSDPAPMSVYRNFASASGSPGSAVSYRLPVPDGAYTLRLHFAEHNRAPGRRLFDIRVNGVVVRSRFDIAAAAGGALKAIALSFPVAAAGGEGVSVDLVSNNSNNEGAIVNGIELTAANPGGVAGPTADVDLSTDNGATWTTIASAVPMDRFGRGSFTWTADAATSGFGGLVRVRANDGPAPQDVSDRPFLIAPAGRDYYVNDASTDGDVFTTAAGDDDNDGKAPGRPMASVSAVLLQYDLGPGDVIHVDTGTYRLLRNIVIGAGDSGVTVRGPDGNTAVLNRNDAAGYVFELRGATDVTLDHLGITGARWGVWATAGSHRLTLSNSDVYANADKGVQVDVDSNFPTITGGDFYGFTGDTTDQNTGIDVESPTSTITHNTVHNMPLGIYVIGRGLPGDLITVADNTVYSNGNGINAFQNVLIARNTVRNNFGLGIYLSRSSRAVDNVVLRNRDGIRVEANGSSASGNRVFGNSGTGLIADGDVALTGNVVYSNGTGINLATFAGLIANNLVYGNTAVGITLAGDGIAERPAANVLNNTVYQPAGDALVVQPGNLVRVRNNVFWAVNGSGIRVNGGDGFNFSSNYNTLVKGSGPLARVATLNGIGVGTLAEWQAEAQDGQSSGADPMFVDFDGPDGLLGYAAGADHGGDDNFHVLPASPTVDAGDPQSYSLSEPAPNGSRANVGYDGNTAQAQTSPSQAVQVLSPNGGERLTLGQPVTVTWRSSGLTVMRPVVLMNAGGPATGPYAANSYSSGATNRNTGRAVDLGGVTDPAPAAVYQTYASVDGATLAYRLPVPDGSYTLRLHFVEPTVAAGARRMEIRLNGTLVRENFDIAATAGGIGRAVVLELPISTSGGAGISLEMASRLTPGQPAIVSGIEVLVSDPNGIAAPAADVEVSFNNGLSWMPVATDVPLDRFGGGSVAWTAGPVATTGATALVRVRATVGTRPEDVSDRPFFVPAPGREFYVNDASTAGDSFTTAPGSLDHDGKSPARPMSSLMALLEAYDLGPGDVVHVDAGTYRLLRDVTITANDAGVRIEGPASGVALFNRGSSAQTAIGFEVRAANVTLDRLSVTGAYTGVHVVAGSHTVTLTNITAFANDYRGIFVEAGADGATIADGTFYGVPGAEATNQNYGVMVSGGRSVITRNTSYEAANSAIRLDAVTGRVTDNEAFRSDIGIEVGRGGTEVIQVTGNIARNNRRYGIWSDFGAKLISGNLAFGNGISGILATANQVRDNLAYANQHGIIVSFAGTAAVVTGNRVFNNSGFGIQNADGNNTFDGNRVYQNSVGFRANNFGGVLQNNAIHSNTNQGVLITASNGAHLYNNTVYQPVGDAVSIQSASSNVRVRNNILWTLAGYVLNVSANSQAGFASDYNNLVRGTGAGANVGHWNGAPQATLAAWQAASGQDAHSLGADPRFLDLDGPDNVLGYTNNGGGYDGGADDNFQLAAGSPAIDAGDAALAPARDFLGLLRADDPGTPNGSAGFADLGAFEFAGDSGDTTPPTITGTTPAAVHSGGDQPEALTQVTVTFSEPVDAVGAAAPANYEFRGAGSDGLFDTADDVVYSLTPHFTVGSADVRLDIIGGTRSSGLYRVTVHGEVGRGVRDRSGVLLDGDGNGMAGGSYVRQFTVTHRSSVVGRHLFYNNSSFDRPLTAGEEPGDDDRALAPDKSALLPGQLATFGNYSSYAKGINGLFIDMKDLPAGGTLTAADFLFKVGNGGDPAGWAAGPAPAAIDIRRGGGFGGSDRVVITFADGSIVNQWLEVTVRATPNTRLSSPDVFYFGSLVGDTGDTASPLRVSVMDLMDFRRVATGSTATQTSRYDFNRDGRVNALDRAALRINLNRSLRPVTTQGAAARAPALAILPPMTPLASSGTGRIPRRVWEEPPPPTA